jgi:SAM-dependent methyltransferase
VGFQVAAFLRKRKEPQYLEQWAADPYLSSHVCYTLGWQSVYGYHRVYDLVRHLRPTAQRGTLHVLSIGPRTEIELYYLWLLFGFAWHNIVGVDLVSSSPKIKLGDMSVKLPFEDNRFDVIVASHCLEKSRSPETTRDEIRRVAKPDARVLVGGDPLPEGSNLYREAPIPCRFFENGVYGLIDFYKLNLSDIEYMDAYSPHGFDIIFKVIK